ncbi:MAG: hypothetical protein MJZ30_11550 [Paludibacteraceae bacterium]|nr:hypothetical protein [Paludibacteraceae bacterium]
MKKYKVNVHYDAIMEVEVLAESEEHAIKEAEYIACDMPRDQLWIPNGIESSCVADEEELKLPFDEAKEKAFSIVKKAEEENVFFSISTVTIPGKIWDGDDYVSASSNSNYVSWDSLAETILMGCGEGYEEIDIDELPEALQYDIFLNIIDSAPDNDIEI